MYGHNETEKRSLLKRIALLSGLALLGLILPLSVAADDDDDDDAGQRYQTANIVDFHSGVMLKGAATLWRSKNSVIANVHTSQLRKKTAYSIWWVIWNDPSLCVGGCGEDDLEIAGNGVFYAGGFVTDTDGTANVTLHLKAGALADGIDVLIDAGLDEDNGFDAEIHLVIRSHGKIIPGMADVQIGSFDGACDVNKCDDDQAVVFLGGRH